MWPIIKWASSTSSASLSPAKRPFLATTSSLIIILSFIINNTAQCFYIDSNQSAPTSEWHYADQRHWSHLNRDCSKRAQSPIDIQHKNVIMSQNLRLHFFNYNRRIKFSLSNAHHTIKMSPIQSSTELLLIDKNNINNPTTKTTTTIMRNNNFAGGVEVNKSTDSVPLADGDDEYLQIDHRRLEVKLHQSESKFSNPKQQASKQQVAASAAAAGASGNKQTQRQHQRISSSSLKELDIEDEQEEEQHQVMGNKQQIDQSLPYGGAASIKLDWLDDGNNEFKLRDIHFHWGERRDNGSEHAIDGRRAAMEMHLVHIKHGLDKAAIGFTSDSVTVIAILIESHRKSNADFNPIVNELTRINATNEAREIDYESIYDLLPSNLNAFYTYSGSLTTPPCYQVVNWIVMAERLNMNAKQIEMFRNLYAPPKSAHLRLKASSSKPTPSSASTHNDGAGDEEEEEMKNQDQDLNDEQQVGEDELIVPNVRALQDLNNRTILASFIKYGNRLEAAWSGGTARVMQAQSHHHLLLMLLIGSFHSAVLLHLALL